jgi:hypothetical protein
MFNEHKLTTQNEHLSYNNQAPIPYLRVEGEFSETIAHQGLYLENQKNKETLNFFANYLKNNFKKNLLINKIPFGFSLINFFQKNFIQKNLILNLPHEYTLGFQKFASYMQIGEESIYEALTLPDSALWYVSIANKTPLKPNFPLSYGCTSILISNKDNTLHARNLDYLSMELWDKHQLIVHVVPKNELAFITLSTLGIPATAITAMNEAGLTLALHQMYTKDSARLGMPVVIIATEIMRKAHNIDEAIQIVEKAPRSGSWFYVLSHGKEKAVIESTHSKIFVRRSFDPIFFQTNHPVSQSIRDVEIMLDPGSFMDSYERAEIIAFHKSKIEKNLDKLNLEQTLIDLLGDPRRLNLKSSTSAGIITKLENIHSVVMDPKNIRFIVGYNQNPYEAPNEGIYYEYKWLSWREKKPFLVSKQIFTPKFKLKDEQKILRKLLRQASSINLSDINAENQERLKVLTQYIDFVQKNKKVIESSSQGIFLYTIQNLKILNQIENKKEKILNLLKLLELAFLDPEINFNHYGSQHRKSLLYLVQGWLYDLTEAHSSASLSYDKAIKEAVFENLKTSAMNYKTNPFKLSQALKLSVNWAAIDLNHY